MIPVGFSSSSHKFVPTVGTDTTSTFVEISNRVIESDVYMGSTADYDGPYDVAEIQTNFTGGTGRIYLGVKFSSTTSYFNDVPIAGVQVLSKDKSTLLHSWIFHDSSGGSGTDWETTQTSPGVLSTQGFPITPSAADALTYYGIVAGSAVNRMTWATSTASSSTGAADGIGSSYVTTIMPTGDAAISQLLNSYYMYCETSGAVVDNCCVARSPNISIPSGSWIRVAHACTSPSSTPQDPNDTLYIAMY